MITSQGKIYLSKMLTVLPFTFLFAPIYTFIFMPIFPFPHLIYFWYSLFIFFSVILAIIIKKYKYIVYPIIIAGAFFARNIIDLPIINLSKTVMYISEESADYVQSVEYVAGISLAPDEITYYKILLFISTAFIGCFCAFYTKQPALDFLKRGNAFLFIFIAMTGGFIAANTLSAIYLALFAGSYFIARNFILINRGLEIYGEKGVYNTSGTHRIFAYYFCLTLLFSVVPVIVAFIIIPFIINQLGAFILATLGFIWKIIERIEYTPNDLEEPDLKSAGEPPVPLLKQVENMEYIIGFIAIAILLFILFIFRKAIRRKTKEIIEMFKTKMKVSNYDENQVINQEIITELPKIKQARNPYKNYLKNSRRISDISKKFLFAYNCLFWELIGSNDLNELKLKKSLTPQELTDILNDLNQEYQDLSSITGMYEDIKYGHIEQNDDALKDMTEKTELLLKRVLS